MPQGSLLHLEEWKQLQGEYQQLQVSIFLFGDTSKVCGYLTIWMNSFEHEAPFRPSLCDDWNLAVVWYGNCFSNPGDTQTVPTKAGRNFPAARQMLLLHFHPTQTAEGRATVVEKVRYTEKRENAGWHLCLLSMADIRSTCPDYINLSSLLYVVHKMRHRIICWRC